MKLTVRVALSVLLCAALAACSKPAAAPAAPAAQTRSGIETEQAGGQAHAQIPADAVRFAVIGAESMASYTAREKFANRELPNEAVGTTQEVQGELNLDKDGNFLPSLITVDLRTLKSESARRDQALRDRWLESDKYPMAEYSLTGVDGPAPKWSDGQPAAFKLSGKLKVHGTEKAVTWDATGTRSGGTLKVEATVALNMSDFGIAVPDMLNMLKAEDGLTLKVDLVARQQ